MENLYSCPICGSMEMKQNGSVFLCRFCKNEFTEEALRAGRSGSGNGGSSGSGVGGSTGSGSGGATPSSGVTPATGYISGMFGAPVVPPSTGGFSAPPDSLIQSIQAGAARNRQSETSDNANGSGASGGDRRSSKRNGSGSGSGNNGSSSGSGNGSGNNGGSSSGGSGSGNSGGSSGSGSGASDSENNVRFLDNVSLMNDLAYELVNGNANAWANIARDKGIINSKQHTEIKYIVATRNCIAHGSGDTVRITAELVTSARNYYELMRRTASQIR